MNFESRTTIQSTLPAFEGVSFTVHTLNEPRRMKARLALADTSRRLREIAAQATAAVGGKSLEDPTKFSPEEMAAFLPFSERSGDIWAADVVPAWIRALLISVQGLTIDGKPATVESFIEDGPAALYAEVARHITNEAGLTKRELGESEPPSTSSAQADGRMNDSSATPAGAAATSTSETAV
jgi:hypothetical protein